LNSPLRHKSTRRRRKPQIFDPQKGYLAITSTQLEHACKQLEQLELQHEIIPKGYAYKAINPDTGELDEYTKLANSSEGPQWQDAMCMELGRLFQGFTTKRGSTVTGTSTCRFIKITEVPKNKSPTYVRIVTADRPNKSEPRRVRMTVGGDKIDYPGDCSTKGADLVTAKCLFNSVVSTANAKFMCMDVKDFYLNNRLGSPEYIRIPLSLIPEEFIIVYNLHDFAVKGYVYAEVNKGMYGLPQAGKIANDILVPILEAGGYKETGTIPGLFKHVTNSIVFPLVVDDFGVKYTDKKDAEHLRNLLQQHYTITEDWTGARFIGINLKWDYKNRTVDLSIKDYVKKALQRFEHPTPRRPQHAPSAWTAPQYGATIQMATPLDNSPELDKKMTTRLQEIIGVFLYYARVVDNTMHVALGTLAAAQAHGTTATMEAAVHLLNYAATHPNATL
jgi:Reverse transcriptase (RNA-dependent DNA polymerase)